MALLTKLLGISDLTPESASLTTKYLTIDLFRIFAFNMASMFIILYLLDTLELVELGFLYATGYIVTTLVDYPTSALGDTIGHKKVLILAYLFHIFSIALLVFSDTFLLLLLYNVLSSFAGSQESGALESWFDNNYRLFTEEIDNDRSIYKNFQARKSFFNTMSFVMALITGGIIAQVFSRKALFVVFLGFIFMVFLLIITLMTSNNSKSTRITRKKYLNQFSGGFRFLFSHRGIFSYFLGTTIIWAANSSVWISFLLFPTYENYSGGEDSLTALFRTIIFITGAVWQLFIVKFISRFKRVHLWIFITTSLSNPVFFTLIYLYYLYVPPTSLDFFTVFGLLLIFQIPSMFESLEFTLRNRLNLDLVPDDYRNSVYSLLPTLTTLIGILGAVVGGWFIGEYGFISGVLFAAGFSAVGALVTGLGLKVLPSTALEKALNERTS